MNQLSESAQPGLELFVEEFLGDRLQELESFRRMAANTEWSDLYDLAHRWKGICKPYGFGRLGEIADQICADIKSFGHLPNSQKIAQEIHNYLMQKKQSLPS